MDPLQENTIGFIGLGQMGGGMASNLAKSTIPLIAYDLNPDSISSIVAFGAQNGESLDKIRNICELVFICLPGEDEVESVLLGEDGLLQRPGKLKSIIDTSTLSFVRAREFAAECEKVGVGYSDSPVSGLPKRALDGSLTIMFGGSVESFERARPYLDVMGKQVLHCGEVGAGQMTKAINNIIYNINIAGFCEVLPLAMKAGLDPEMLQQLVLAGSSRSFASEHFVPKIMQGKFDDDFPMQAAYKDIINVQQIVDMVNGETPLVDAMTNIYDKALTAGYGQQPKSAMIKIFEKKLGVALRKRT